MIKNPKYLDGYLLAIKNAQSLQSVGRSAAEKGEYGIATSLCILASEEALKAAFLLVRHVNPGIDTSDFQKVFNEHAFKHEHIASFLAMYSAIYDRSVAMMEDLREVEALGDIPGLPSGARIKFLEEITAIKREVEWTTANDEISKVEIKKALVWWKNANFKKNAGLYVELVNKNKWRTPQHTEKRKYIEADKYTTLIIQYVEFTKRLFDDPNVRALAALIEKQNSGGSA